MMNDVLRLSLDFVEAKMKAYTIAIAWCERRFKSVLRRLKRRSSEGTKGEKDE